MAHCGTLTSKILHFEIMDAQYTAMKFFRSGGDRMSLRAAVNAGFSPNSPTEDPHGFAAGITMNPLREVFESMNYDENYYLRNNETWHLHDPSNMMLKDGILKGINKFEISEMIRLISGEFQEVFQVKNNCYLLFS